jgi:hypothetical protein
MHPPVHKALKSAQRLDVVLDDALAMASNARQGTVCAFTLGPFMDAAQAAVLQEILKSLFGFV